MEYVEVLLPTIFVSIIFFFVIRALFNADRKEREAQAESLERYDGENTSVSNIERVSETESEDGSSNTADRAKGE
ncbi:cbb3-type cytochrome oxidase subunit 3 [Neomicrococcus aestuarii]|uniref:Cbb3-type cytochrome oxidase subunit 3 n=1 Tax=Neomicrococcus aestuarii TaxID=556325 RepID=A0A7W8TTM1_9MICC|nr:hypothetical protein [Neomicrococcus aestuarii]MBB5512694.1 cbb3-type cytochrome oxidase subunit 3 [Neomicrococcus aestuarii]